MGAVLGRVEHPFLWGRQFPGPSVRSSLFCRGLRSSSECILVPTPAREGLFKNPPRMEGLFAQDWDFPSFADADAGVDADAGGLDADAGVDADADAEAGVDVHVDAVAVAR